MKRIRFFQTILILCLSISLQLQGQSSMPETDVLQRLKTENNYYSGVQIKLDTFIEENYYKHLIYNKNNGAILGWRIRIFSGSGHDAFEKANQTRAKFISKYENIKAYITYIAPDYKVYVGDCRTRSEVLKLFQEINSDFPYAFLVSQPINVSQDN
jgi:hypothetical protein